MWTMLHSRRLIRSFLLLACCCSCGVDPAIADTAKIRGIYLLDGLPDLDDIPLCNEVFIDGFAWRTSWPELDSGRLGPAYHFETVTQAVTDLQAIDKKLSIMVFAITVPEYVLRDSETLCCQSIPAGDPNQIVPVLWDSAARAWFRAFMKALANHEIMDTSTGLMTKFCDHPTLAGLRVGVIGLKGLDDTRVVDHPTYTRAGFIAGALDDIHSVQDVFPTKPCWVELRTLYDSTPVPRLDEALIDAIGAEFDGTPNPHVGVFIEQLRGDAPLVGIQQGINLLDAHNNWGCPVNLQACGSWLNHAPCSWTGGDDIPSNGFTFGYNNYGSVYYEIYKSDLTNAAWESMFTTWQEDLQTLP